MPTFIPVKKVKRSKKTKEDIKIGDVWKVNFPSAFKSHKMKNGDSKYCTYHPAMVIGINDEERCIEVVELTHYTGTSHKMKIEGTDLEVDCEVTAFLKPDHFRVYVDNIDPTSERYMEIIKEIKKAKDDGSGVTLTQEQWIDYNMNMIEEASTDTNLLISEDDIYVNFNKWKSGKSNVLFIIGLSGSGKSTISKKMASKYHAIRTETDTIAFRIAGHKRAVVKGWANFEWLSENDPMVAKYLREKNIDPLFLSDPRFDVSKAKPTRDKESEEIIQQEVDKYIHWLCYEQKQRVVIEGGHGAVCITRHPDMYKNFPCIIKGTSIAKSMFRRTVRDVDEPKDLILRPYILIKQYAKMVPEMNAARKVLLNDNEWKYVKESMLQEGATMTIKGKVPSCKDFKDFCSKIKTPGDALKWFIKNKVQWPKGDANKYPFHWPDDLVKEKIGNCFDQTVFMHYFCKKKRIDHRMFIISWVGDNGYSTGHAVPMYEKNGYVWIWLYLYPGYGMVGGPFRDYDEAKKTLDQYFLVSVNKALKSPTTPYSSFLDDADVSKFDDYYGNHDITQEDYIMMNHGYNLKSTHMFRFNVGGRSFYNPFGDLLRTIDVLKELYRLFKSQDKVEESYISEDDSYQTID